MEINEIIKLIEAVSANGLTSFVLEENGSKISMKKEKEMVQVMTAAVPAPQMMTSSMASADAQVLAASAGTLFPSAMSAVSGTQTAAGQADAVSIGSDRVVSSPLVGTFYNCPSPDADSFVKVGDTVKKGQVLGIIEAMKLMNEIESEFDGIVEAVLVENEEVVEYGQPLFRIK